MTSYRFEDTDTCGRSFLIAKNTFYLHLFQRYYYDCIYCSTLFMFFLKKKIEKLNVFWEYFLFLLVMRYGTQVSQLILK